MFNKQNLHFCVRGTPPQSFLDEFNSNSSFSRAPTSSHIPTLQRLTSDGHETGQRTGEFQSVGQILSIVVTVAVFDNLHGGPVNVKRADLADGVPVLGNRAGCYQ